MPKFTNKKSIYYNDVNLLARPTFVDESNTLGALSRKNIPVELNRVYVSPMQAIIGKEFAIKANELGLGLCLHRFPSSVPTDRDWGSTEGQIKIFKALQDTSNVFVGLSAGRVNNPAGFGKMNTFIGSLSGYSANSFKILCQIVSGDTQPTSTAWREIDFTSDISGTSINGYLTVSGLTGTTFQITNSLYSSASTYNLANYIDIPENGYPEILNFGDEYYFYGNLETDITATIYEMRYLINLGRNQFTNTSNPTWTSGTTSYVTEIGLYDSNYDLIVISKLQSPELRQGIQQYVVKLDF